MKWKIILEKVIQRGVRLIWSAEKVKCEVTSRLNMQAVPLDGCIF